MGGNRKMPLNQEDLIIDVFEKCRKNNINVRLAANRNGEDKSTGSFCEDEFVSVIDIDDWMEIFVHESCHLDQYLEKSPLWNHPLVKDFNIFDADLLKHCPDKAEKAFWVWCELEIDCDIRVLKKLKKYNLDIDVKKYIQKSNCYHQSYYYFQKYSIFYDLDNIPYANEELYSTFSDKEMLSVEELWVENPVLEKFLVHHNSII
jgi:hypothetical protein